MNYDSTINQDISLRNRKDLTISSVKKINSLNDLLFDIETGYGRIKIEGKNLDMIYNSKMFANKEFLYQHIIKNTKF